MSLQFDKESHMAMSELYYIQQKAGRVIPPPKMDYLRKISEEYGFPVGAHPDVLGLSFHYGKHFAEQGDATGARYCWQITYELTDDANVFRIVVPHWNELKNLLKCLNSGSAQGLPIIPKEFL